MENCVPFHQARDQSETIGGDAIGIVLDVSISIKHEITREWIHSDEVVRLPDAPPFCAFSSFPVATLAGRMIVPPDRYEFDPQGILQVFPVRVGSLWWDARDHLDGIIIGWPADLEPGAWELIASALPRKGARYFPVSLTW